jgi:hypothetical protein
MAAVDDTRIGTEDYLCPRCSRPTTVHTEVKWAPDVQTGIPIMSMTYCQKGHVLIEPHIPR